MNHYTINKPKHGSEEWLKVRWQTPDGEARISASAAAAVHGQHNYTTGGDLAVELLASDAPTPKEQNQAMERGNRLEPMIREWASSMFNMNIVEPDIMYCYDEPGVRLISTLDGMDGSVPVEIKTTTKRWDNELPRQWYWQGVQQAICANTDRVDWIIFDSSMQLFRYAQRITSDEKRIHIEACREFLADIDAGIMPFGAEIRAEHASTLHPVADGTSTELDSNGAELVHALAELKSEIKRLEKAESELRGRVGLLMGDAETGVFDGQQIVTWKNQTRTSFDQKRFEKEHPALAEKFRKSATIRVMRIKGEK